MKLGTSQAILWALGAFLATIFAVSAVLSLRPHADHDPVVAAGVQAIVYFAAGSLFAARRPGRTWSETFAVRRTSIWIVLLAAALGVLACLPAFRLAGFIEELRPMSLTDKAAHDSAFEIHSLAHGVLLYLFLSGVGPFAEELLFRGALYSGLRPAHTSVSAGLTTSALFTLTHLEPRFLLSIFGIALLFAVVRAVSGSLWPSVFMHVAFNATALGMPFSNPHLEHPGMALVGGCVAASAVVLGLIVWIGNVSQSADRARRVDLEPDPGLGETLS